MRGFMWRLVRVKCTQDLVSGCTQLGHSIPSTHTSNLSASADTNLTACVHCFIPEAYMDE